MKFLVFGGLIINMYICVLNTFVSFLLHFLLLNMHYTICVIYLIPLSKTYFFSIPRRT